MMSNLWGRRIDFPSINYLERPRSGILQSRGIKL